MKITLATGSMSPQGWRDALAQAFFTVLEARRACNQGHVETAMKLYDSIPLGPVMSEIAD